MIKKLIPAGNTEDDILIDSAMKGVIYWRVVELGKDEYFYSQQFEYQPLDAPVFYNPGYQQNYSQTLPAGLEFSWEKKYDFSYEAEIQQLDGGIDGAQKFKSDYPSYLVKKLTPGHYQIKIRGIKNNVATEWSTWQPFSVGKVEQNQIELLAPNDLENAKLNQLSKDVTFEWNSTGTQFLIQISNDENFKDVVTEAITDKKLYSWHPTKEGKYFWHVITGTKSNKIISRSFNVVEPKLAIIEPLDKIEYIFKDQGNENVKFSWADVSLNHKYTIEFSYAPDFIKIFDQAQTEKPEFKYSIPRKPSLIYWRVRTIHQISDIRSIKMSPIKIAPVIPIEQTKVKILPVISIGPTKVKIIEDHTVMNKMANKSQLDSKNEFIEIFLPQVKDASSYYVEIMKDTEGKNIILNKTLNSPIFRWIKPTPGTFFWRVSYRDHDGNLSQTSKVARLIIEPKVIIDTNPFTKMPY